MLILVQPQLHEFLLKLFSIFSLLRTILKILPIIFRIFFPRIFYLFILFYFFNCRDHEVDVFSKFSISFDTAVKNMHKTAADQTQKCQKYYKMEFQTIGKAFQQLGNALQQDGNYRKHCSKLKKKKSEFSLCFTITSLWHFWGCFCGRCRPKKLQKQPKKYK